MDNDDCRRFPLPNDPLIGVAFVGGEARNMSTPGDSDGLPPDWVEGVTLDYYRNKGGLLLGPFDATPVRP